MAAGTATTPVEDPVLYGSIDGSDLPGYKLLVLPVGDDAYLAQSVFLLFDVIEDYFAGLPAGRRIMGNEQVIKYSLAPVISSLAVLKRKLFACLSRSGKALCVSADLPCFVVYNVGIEIVKFDFVQKAVDRHLIDAGLNSALYAHHPFPPGLFSFVIIAQAFLAVAKFVEVVLLVREEGSLSLHGCLKGLQQNGLTGESPRLAAKHDPENLFERPVDCRSECHGGTLAARSPDHSLKIEGQGAVQETVEMTDGQTVLFQRMPHPFFGQERNTGFEKRTVADNAVMACTAGIRENMQDILPSGAFPEADFHCLTFLRSEGQALFSAGQCLPYFFSDALFLLCKKVCHRSAYIFFLLPDGELHDGFSDAHLSGRFKPVLRSQKSMEDRAAACLIKLKGQMIDFLQIKLPGGMMQYLKKQVIAAARPFFFGPEPGSCLCQKPCLESIGKVNLHMPPEGMPPAGKIIAESRPLVKYQCTVLCRLSGQPLPGGGAQLPQFFYVNNFGHCVVLSKINAMKKISILGAGRMSHAMAFDLSRDFRVTLVDRDEEALELLKEKYGVETEKADLLREGEVARVTAGADLVIGAVPGFMAHQTLGAVIASGKNMVDISFGPEDPFEWDGLAREKNVTAIVDAGVAPGMSNLFLGRHAAMGPVQSFACYVGGLPVERKWPFEYKAPFSPVDVIEEYTRPARYRKGGKPVVMPALSEPERIDFEAIGSLEAFNTDGLRTLLRTMEVPDMVEKTLRYPGHRALMEAFRETGLFSEEKIEIKGTPISPLEVTAAKLLEHWKLEEDEAEFTVMRVDIRQEGRLRRYQLLDFRDPESGLSSMARSTGFAATAMARAFLAGLFEEKGIRPPEFLAANEAAFEFIMKHLKSLGVEWLSFDVQQG